MRTVATCIAVSVFVSANLLGQDILLDEKFDGDLSNWSILDTTIQPVSQPWGPADVEIDNNALRFQTAGEIPPNPAPRFFETGLVVATLDRSAVDDRFGNGFFRGTVRTDTESNASLFLRSDITTFSGYQFTGIGSLNEFRIFRFIDGAGTLLGQMNKADDPKFSVGDNWVIEAGAVDSRLSMRVWRKGESEPTEPQLVIFDDVLSGGQIALGPAVSPVDIGQPTRMDVTYDNILFRAVPEPSSHCIILFGFPMLVSLIRRQRSECTSMIELSHFWLFSGKFQTSSALSLGVFLLLLSATPPKHSSKTPDPLGPQRRLTPLVQSPLVS